MIPALLALLLAVDSRGANVTPAANGQPVTRIEYEGTLFYEAHFRHPGDVHPYHSRAIYSTDPAGDARLDWSTWEGSDSLALPETYLLTHGRMLHRDAPGQPWLELKGPRMRQARLQASAGLPGVLGSVTRAEPGRAGAWQATRGQWTRYTYLQTHPRLGDVRDTVLLGYPSDSDVPDSLAIALTMRDYNWRLTSRRVRWSRELLADSLFALPDSVSPAPANEEDDIVGVMPPLVRIADGVWSADLSDIDSRTVIVEFADHLAVIETAVGSANGERIVDAARLKWPGKPIRYALFSHYHPHYTGGLRALIAAGATIVTTPGNEAFVRNIATLAFKTAPDRLAAHPRPVSVTTFADSIDLADATNRVVAYNYGERSLHTDEFVLFWLPRQRLLFQSEQGWSRSNGKLRAGRRARGLLTWIDERHLDVERLLQGWPMRDQDALLTRVELDSLAPPPR